MLFCIIRPFLRFFTPLHARTYTTQEYRYGVLQEEWLDLPISEPNTFSILQCVVLMVVYRAAGVARVYFAVGPILISRR